MSENAVVEEFFLDMESSNCGYPICCPGRQPIFIKPQFWPKKVTDLGLDRELKAFMEKAEKIFHKTGMPVCPFILHHLCLPFSPVCAELYCASRRKDLIDEHIQNWNQTYALEKGLYLAWNDDYYIFTQYRGRVLRNLKPGIELLMNLPKRREYCQRHGIAFNPPAKGNTWS